MIDAVEFNVKDWGGERIKDDKRWKYGIPSKGNANFAWVQHIVHHLAPNGTAGFVLANGSMSSNQSGENEIRKNLIEEGIVDCMIALPGQLFYSTQIPACLWFLSRNSKSEILFIDARKLGRMVDRTHRELTNEEINHITGKYHAWRGKKSTSTYTDVPGFCKSATLDEVRAYSHILTPGRYVGTETNEDDDELFEEKIKRLTLQFRQQQAEGVKLYTTIVANLKKLGYDFLNNVE